MLVTWKLRRSLNSWKSYDCAVVYPYIYVFICFLKYNSILCNCPLTLSIISYKIRRKYFCLFLINLMFEVYTRVVTKLDDLTKHFVKKIYSLTSIYSWLCTFFPTYLSASRSRRSPVCWLIRREATVQTNKTKYNNARNTSSTTSFWKISKHLPIGTDFSHLCIKLKHKVVLEVRS